MKSLRCLVSLHSWERVSADDGTGRFLRCRRCAKHDYSDRGRAGDWGQGMFGGGR